MSENNISVQKFYNGILFLLSAWFIGAVIYVTLSRISYPFDLEWMEGGSLIQMIRLLEGKLLYVKPSLEYIPFIYPPLYYYLSAGLATIIHSSWFLPLRLVSLTASAGIILLIFFIVKGQTRSILWGFFAAGFFAATFQAGGSWFDIARVDMVYIFFLLAAVYLLQKNNWLAGVLSGLLFVCAFFTKQTAIFPIAAMLAYTLIFGVRKTATAAALTFVICSAGWIWSENVQSGGWFWYYVFTLPQRHSLIPKEFGYLGQPLIIILPVIIAAGASFWRIFSAPRATMTGKEGIWPVFALVTLASTILTSLNPGSFNNNYLPFYSAVSITFGINFERLSGELSRSDRPLKLAVLYSVCIVQFIILFYNPPGQIPSHDDLAAGNELVALVKKVEGEVLAPNHNALPILAGKKPYAHLIALQEIRGNFGNPDETDWEPLQAEISLMLASHNFGAILLDNTEDIWADVPKYYVQKKVPYKNENVFWPVTGGHTRPEYIFTP